MILRAFRLGLLAVIVGHTGCKGKHLPGSAAQAKAQPTHTASSPIDKDAGTTHATIPLESRSSVAVHCKALEARGTVTLTTVKKEDGTRLFARNGAVYLFSYHKNLARVRLTKIARDGTETKLIASQQGLGAPAHYQLTPHAAYYSRHGSVVRVGLDDGVISEVATGLSPAFAVHTDRIYGTVRGRQGADDELVVIEHLGDSPKPVATIPAPTSRRDYAFRNVSADDRDVFISDWDARRIIAVSLKDRTLHTIVSNQGFALVREVEPDAIVFSSASGLYRQLRSGDKPTRLSEIGKAPTTISFDSDDSHFWMYQTEHFEDIFGIFRVPRAGDTTTRFATFPSYIPGDPLHEDGFEDLTVDDECLYYARRVTSGTDKLSILARPKNG